MELGKKYPFNTSGRTPKTHVGILVAIIETPRGKWYEFAVPEGFNVRTRAINIGPALN